MFNVHFFADFWRSLGSPYMNNCRAFASIKLNIDRGTTIKVMPASTRGLSHAKFIDGEKYENKFSSWLYRITWEREFRF